VAAKPPVDRLPGRKVFRQHLPTDTRGTARVDDRRIIGGIVHVLKSGGRWVDALAPTAPAGGKIQHVIKKVRPHLFVFLTNREIEPTNNGSERALRPCAVYRKRTNGFRSQWGAKFYADIRSVVETARRRSIRAFDAIRLTLQGKPLPCAA